MFESLKTLAIGVESYITTEETEAAARLAQESKEKTFWIIMLAIFLVALTARRYPSALPIKYAKTIFNRSRRRYNVAHKVCLTLN